jgi:DNA-binding protein HU-beta
LLGLLVLMLGDGVQFNRLGGVEAFTDAAFALIIRYKVGGNAEDKRPVVFNLVFFGIIGVADISVLEDVLCSIWAVDLAEDKAQQFVLVIVEDMLLEGRRHRLCGVYIKLEMDGRLPESLAGCNFCQNRVMLAFGESHLTIKTNSIFKGDRMNKAELIAAVAEHSQLSKADTGRILEGLLKTIELTLAAGDSLTLVGFGTFAVKERAERTGRNPQTGREITIAAAKLPSFKPGKALKDAVNG